MAKYLANFDVSGTEIRMSIFEELGNQLRPVHDAPIKTPLTKGFNNIVSGMGRLMHDTLENRDVESLLIVGGFAARFEAADGTVPYYDNGTLSVQREVSGIHFGSDCVGKDWKLGLEGLFQETPVQAIILNDAAVQQQAMLEHSRRAFAPELYYGEFRGGTTLYIGPGTGFGCSIADMDKNGNIKIRTSGHMYYAKVEITDEMLSRIQALFPNHSIHLTPQADLVRRFDGLEKQTYGDLLPKMTGTERNIYIVRDGDKKYVLPVRFLASTDGIEHLLADELSSGITMKDLGKCTPEEMKAKYPTAFTKLELYGEVMARFITQFQEGTLGRLPLSKGVNPIAYDWGVKGLQNLKGILLGGGGLADGVGEVVQSVIQGHNDTLIYRPDSRTQELMPKDLLYEVTAKLGLQFEKGRGTTR